MLSNKLTFSLSFIVMLVFGLAILATPAFAAPSYDATWATATNWTINVYFPLADDPQHATNDGDPATPKITTATGGDGLAGIDIKGADGEAVAFTANSLSTNALDKDGAVTSDRASVVKFRYQFQVVAPADPAGLADGKDDTEITITLDGGYSPITIGLKHRTSGIKETAFSKPVEDVNAFSFTLTKVNNEAVGFAVIVKKDTATGGGDVLDNGIRTGTDGNYVDSANTIIQKSLPDLDAFFRSGGTIKLANDPGNTGDAVVASGEAFITEIMWGVDGGDLTASPITDHQWIEVYYQGSQASVDLQLQFVFNAHDSAGLDAVGNLYLAKWNPPGQSGHTQYGRFNGEPPVPLVSMYRKRSITVGGAAGTAHYYAGHKVCGHRRSVRLPSWCVGKV